MPTHLKIPDGAIADQLQALIDQNFAPSSTGIFVNLYQSNYTPTNTDTIATYTAIQCNFPGYGAVPYSNTDWTAPVVSASIATSTLPLTTFTCTGVPTPAPQIAYGYFISTSVFGLAWAQLFDTPMVFNNGDSRSFTPQFTYQSKY